MIHSTGFGNYSQGSLGAASLGAAKSADVAALQKALNALATSVGDQSLRVVVDGLTGPGTAKAANLAMTQYVKAGQAHLRTGKLTPAQVRTNAATLASLVETAAGRAMTSKNAPGTASGRTASPRQIRDLQLALRALGVKTGDQTLAQVGVDGLIGPQTRGAVARVISRYNVVSPTGGVPTAPQLRQSSVASALTSAIEKKAVSVTKSVPPAPSKPTRSPTVERLQRALVQFGRLLGNATLRQIGVDGIAGPQTAAGVFAAMQHVPVTMAVPGVGKWDAGLKKRMTPAQVKKNAEMLARIIEAAIAARGKKPQTRVPDAPSGRTKRSPRIAEIQQLLGQLGEAAQDPALTVVVDGILGKGTTAAVNRALSATMSVAQVANQAPEIISRLKAAIAQAGAPAPVPKPPPPPEPDPQADAEAEAARQDAAQPTPVEEGEVTEEVPRPTPQPQVPQQEVPEYQFPEPGQDFQAEADDAVPEVPEYIPPPPDMPPEAPAMPDMPPPPSFMPPAPSPDWQQTAAEMPPGEDMVPADDMPPPVPPPAPEAEKEGVPLWVWLTGGAVALVGVGAAVFLMARKKSGGAQASMADYY